MDEFKAGMPCPITGWQIVKADYNNYTVTYTIVNQGISRTLFLSTEYVEYAKTKKDIIRWLLFINKFPCIESQQDLLRPSSKLITAQLIDKVLSETAVPKTPKEKLDQLLADLFRLFPDYKGEIVSDILLKFTLFKNITELRLFIDSLASKNYISFHDTAYESVGRGKISHHAKGKYVIEIKYQALNHLATLESQTKYSKNCFIAMSFSKNAKMDSIRETIKSTLERCNYTPVLIDEVHYDSDQTINDAILAEIKKSKFLIADFTEQKDGVYFEAGFALGLGLPVIYCCHKDDFEKTHFDLNHYPHIIYDTNDQLREALKSKIEAWID